MAPSTDRIDLAIPPAPAAWTHRAAIAYVRARLVTLGADAQDRRSGYQSGSWAHAYATGSLDGLRHALAVLDAAEAGVVAPERRS